MIEEWKNTRRGIFRRDNDEFPHGLFDPEWRLRLETVAESLRNPAGFTIFPSDIVNGNSEPVFDEFDAQVARRDIRKLAGKCSEYVVDPVEIVNIAQEWGEEIGGY